MSATRPQFAAARPIVTPVARLTPLWAAIRGDCGPRSGANLASIVELMPLALITRLLSVAVLVFALHGDLGGPALYWWLAGEGALVAAVAARWNASRARSAPGEVAQRIYRRVLVFSVIMAAPWAVLPLRFIPQADGGDAALILTLCMGMAMGGAVFLSRMALPAILFVATIMAGVVAACVQSPDPAVAAFALYPPVVGVFLIALIAAGASMARARDRTIALLTDANQRLTATQRRIQRMALEDPETGLPNRKALLIELESRLSGGCGRLAVAVFGLRRVKALAAVYGHPAAEALIVAQAARLQERMGADEHLARLDAETFALIYTAAGDAPETSAAVARAEALLAALCQPVDLLGRAVHPRASAGVALSTQGAPSASELVARSAEAARIAETGEARAVTLYRPGVMRSARERDALERDLRAALSGAQDPKDGENGLHVFYQPKVNLADHRIVGAEALLRWRHPERGMQPPDSFLSLAEERGFLPSLSRFVFDRVRSDILAWRADGLRAGRIAVNAHPVDLETPDLLLGAFERFRASGIGSDDLVLEITENCVFNGDGAPAGALLAEIQALGFELSLDDFGTGRASLSHLKRLPVQELKIDREFVSGLGVHDGDEAIVCAALEVARRLGIRSVAEGVETVEEARRLKDLGCHAAQGYLFARPLPEAAFAALLRADVPLANALDL